MLVGAYAVAAHGLPRATGDIDLWIKCSQNNADRVWSLSRDSAPQAQIYRSKISSPQGEVELRNRHTDKVLGAVCLCGP